MVSVHGQLPQETNITGVGVVEESYFFHQGSIKQGKSEGRNCQGRDTDYKITSL